MELNRFTKTCTDMGGIFSLSTFENGMLLYVYGWISWASVSLNWRSKLFFYHCTMSYDMDESYGSQSENAARILRKQKLHSLVQKIPDWNVDERGSFGLHLRTPRMCIRREIRIRLKVTKKTLSVKVFTLIIVLSYST